MLPCSNDYQEKRKEIITSPTKLAIEIQLRFYFDHLYHSNDDIQKLFDMDISIHDTLQLLDALPPFNG